MLQARDLQARANRVTETMIAFDFMGALYTALRILGVDCGVPRLPALPLTHQREEALRAALDAADFRAVAEL